MRGVVFDVSVPRYLLAKSAGRISDAFLFGAASGVSMRNVEEPPLPGPGWVRLETVLAGICGSDIANLGYEASPAMEPFGSFPAVIGHEILGRVVEVGPGVRALERGQRVAVDPMISCLARGRERTDWCASCASGLASTCENAGEPGPLHVGDEPLARGLTIGYHRSLPGGWGERLIAHESQLHPVPDPLSDKVAVLVEPLSIGVHAVLQQPPPHSRDGEPVLVIGSGPIALATVWALRATGFQGEVVAQTKRAHEADLARALGASSVVTPGDGARQALIDTGAQAYMPIVGPEVYSGGGFPLIYDCVGSRESLEQALRYASARGRIVLLGCAGQLGRIDLTFLWSRELDVKGFVGYGTERWHDRDAHTFEITQQLLVETGAPVDRMITHLFPLGQFRDALRVAAHRRKTGSVKVLLDPKI
jgi:threonine dehydrogenase-like Zn-dependent dehydrogenase